MDKLIRERVKGYRESIVNVKKCDEDLKLARKVMPGMNVYFWLDYEVNISWAVKSIDEVKVVLKAFAKRGIMLEHFYESDTQPKWKLKGKNVGIRLCPDWFKEDNAEGATCKLVKIGEETITYPKYKLVCDTDMTTV